jgi:hypothetical protein
MAVVQAKVSLPSVQEALFSPSYLPAVISLQISSLISSDAAF